MEHTSFNHNNKKIRRLIFDAEQPVPEEQQISLPAEHRIMAAISSLEKKVDASFSVLEKKVDDSISGLEKKVDDSISGLEKKVGVLSETLAEVVALLKLQIKKEPDVQNFIKFPIESTMELEHLNSIITPELTDFYINKIRSLLGTSSSMASSLKHVLDEKLILDYNVDGTSESAVKMKIPDEPADKIIRKAIHNIKNSHFQKTSREKNSN
ncbi:uncharacterized protein [Drosophila pseudoobscura]|uniref:DUF4806 domain-containing protein n=1 Tax=Drosophila pseudoobscura pseudoobscura TaxID=46245 RepID=A0A6I8VYL0_DROPS|nr:uncharacterized protein LOC6902631 [Drosophila pseudoobscura]